MKVADYRNLITRLENLISCSIASCCSMHELASVARSLKSCGTELIHAACKTAKSDDIERKERALDRSATLINFILLD